MNFEWLPLYFGFVLYEHVWHRDRSTVDNNKCEVQYEFQANIHSSALQLPFCGADVHE